MPSKRSSFSIGAKLSLVMCLISTVTVIAMSYGAYTVTRDAVTEQAQVKFRSVARLKTSLVESVLQSIENDLVLQAQSIGVIEALEDFSVAYASMPNASESLRSTYIDENPHPIGARDQMVSAGTFSGYDAAHAKFHPAFRAAKDSLGYYDIFLFNVDGDLIYSVFKESDFATNVVTGEWRDTGLGKVFAKANAGAHTTDVAFDDFAPYGPSFGAAASFIAAPVFGPNGDRLGVLAYQMPVETINHAVQDVSSLGATSDAFLVGRDGLLRSDSLISAGDDVLTTRVDTTPFELGFQGERGFASYQSRIGAPVLGYYEGITFNGASWVVVVEQETAVLFGVVRTSLISQLKLAAVLLGIALVASVLFSRSLALPLRRLAGAVQTVAGGDYAHAVPDTHRGDEVGQIANALEDFRGSLAAADALAKDAAFKTAGFESSDTAMMLTDPDLRIIGINSAVSRLLDLRSAEFATVNLTQSGQDLIGMELDHLGFVTGAAREKIQDVTSLPYSETIKVDAAYIGVTAREVRDRDGVEIGRIVELKDETQAMSTRTLVDAIDAQQVRVEFALDRRVTSANPHFATVTGQAPSAVIGTDGAQLISREDAGASDAWKAAEAGQYTVGRFTCLGSDGSVIFNGSLSPVPDHEGRTAGFLFIGADVTEARRAVARIEANDRAKAAEQAQVVDALRSGLTRLSSGDLTAQIDTQFAREYEQLRTDFNAAIERLRLAVSNIVDDTVSIDDKTAEITAAVQELSKRTEDQAATLEESAAAIHELTESVSSSSQSTDRMAKASSEARTNAESSGEIVRKAVTAMHEIAESSKKVSSIVSVIDDVAFQTNLLALNAGVEAARAGSAGQGFAVVASEVRALAQRCSDAAREITDLITTSGKQVEHGVKLVTGANSALEDILTSVTEISDHVTSIATTAVEQSSGIGEINIAISELDQSTQANAAMAEETFAATRSLSDDVHGLSETAKNFVIDPNHRESQRGETDTSVQLVS